MAYGFVAGGMGAGARRAARPSTTTYNMAIMSPEAWLESAGYRRTYCVHDMRHVVEVPVKIAERMAGNVHFATTA